MWEYRWAMIQRELFEANTDFICLQEVDMKYYNDYKDFLKKLDYDHFVLQRTGENSDACILAWKNNIKMLNHVFVKFNEYNLRDNVAIIADFEIKQKRIRIACTHLLFNRKRSDVRMEQFKKIMEYNPTIIAGDFNFTKKSEEFVHACKNYVPTNENGISVNHKDTELVDFIFYKQLKNLMNNVKLYGVKIPNFEHGSDHYPMIALFGLE
jgi:endonuclease/exonuclease/phosphatase family metal-dependent hydrolase